jgi:hypothetical protein
VHDSWVSVCEVCRTVAGTSFTLIIPEQSRCWLLSAFTKEQVRGRGEVLPHGLLHHLARRPQQPYLVSHWPGPWVCPLLSQSQVRRIGQEDGGPWGRVWSGAGQV